MPATPGLINQLGLPLSHAHNYYFPHLSAPRPQFPSVVNGQESGTGVEAPPGGTTSSQTTATIGSGIEAPQEKHLNKTTVSSTVEESNTLVPTPQALVSPDTFEGSNPVLANSGKTKEEAATILESSTPNSTKEASPPIFKATTTLTSTFNTTVVSQTDVEPENKEPRSKKKGAFHEVSHDLGHKKIDVYYLPDEETKRPIYSTTPTEVPETIAVFRENAPSEEKGATLPKPSFDIPPPSGQVLKQESINSSVSDSSTLMSTQSNMVVPTPQALVSSNTFEESNSALANLIEAKEDAATTLESSVLNSTKETSPSIFKTTSSTETLTSTYNTTVLGRTDLEPENKKSLKSTTQGASDQNSSNLRRRTKDEETKMPLYTAHTTAKFAENAPSEDEKTAVSKSSSNIPPPSSQVPMQESTNSSFPDGAVSMSAPGTTTFPVVAPSTKTTTLSTTTLSATKQSSENATSSENFVTVSVDITRTTASSNTTPAINNTSPSALNGRVGKPEPQKASVNNTGTGNFAHSKWSYTSSEHLG